MKFLLSIVYWVLIPVVAILIAFNIDWVWGFLATFSYGGFLLWVYRVSLYSFLGKVFYVRGKTQQGLALLKHACRIKKAKPEVKILYGYLLLKLGDMIGAEKVFDSLLNQKLQMSQKMSIRSNQALILWKKGTA